MQSGPEAGWAATTSGNGQEAGSLFSLEALGGKALGTVGAPTRFRKRSGDQSFTPASGEPEEEAGCFFCEGTPASGPKVQTNRSGQAFDSIARQAAGAPCCTAAQGEGTSPRIGGSPCRSRSVIGRGPPGTEENSFGASGALLGQYDEVRPGEGNRRRPYCIHAPGGVCSRPGAIQGRGHAPSSFGTHGAGCPSGRPGRRHGRRWGTVG
eukprot:1884190-Amphidinium_carterae.1